MKANERYIRLGAVAISVLLHATLFVQLINTALSSQAQAQKYSTRVSLSLLQPVKKSPESIVKIFIKPRKKKENKKKTEAIKKSKPVIQKEIIAPKVAQLIRRNIKGSPAQDIKKNYLSNLLTHIEGYKYYPHAARRRGVTGNIRVSFQLLNDGKINRLEATGGTKILMRAAEQAVHKALPLPSPPPEVDCPIQVSYVMQFKLH